MAENKKKRDKKITKTQRSKKKKEPCESEIVMVRSDDLREIVTETVTKLLADDVLELNDDGTIDLKDAKNIEKYKKKRKKQKEEKDNEK